MSKHIEGIASLIQAARAAPMLSKDEEIALIKHWKKHRGQAEADKIVMAHVRLVISYVQRKYRGSDGEEWRNLVASGCVGLMRALEMFKPEKGFRFSTYARWWIRAEISDTIIAAPMLKTGATSKWKRMFFRWHDGLRHANVTDPARMNSREIAHVAHHFQVTSQEVIDMLAVRAGTIPLDSLGPFDDEEDPPLGSALADENAIDPEETSLSKSPSTNPPHTHFSIS